MGDYYQITLLVTSEQESAIVGLYTQRCWVYMKLRTEQLHDISNKDLEGTTGTENSEDESVSFSKMKFISSKSHTGSNVAMTGGLDYNENDIETEGDLNMDAAYTVVKTEASSFVDDSIYTGMESQYDIGTEHRANNHTETSESATLLNVAMDTTSTAKESVVDLAMQSKELSDADHILPTKPKRYPFLQKQSNSVANNGSRKRLAVPNMRKRKISCQKDRLSFDKTIKKKMSESDIKIETAKSDIKVETEKEAEGASPVKVNRKSEKGGEGFYCSMCNRTFKRKTSYDKHIREEKCILRCDICDKVFAHKWKNNFRKHMKRHNQQYEYKCKECNRQFSDKYTLLHHQQTIHSKERQYKCDNCFKTFTTESTLILHKATNHKVEGKYSCPKCQKVFEKAERLGEHLKFKHLIGQDRLLPCSFCGNMYTARYLPIHEKLNHKETKEFNCELCPAAFMRSLDLRYHMRRHTKSYSEYCETCGRGCYSRTELKNHMRTHSGEKPFGCTLCDYRCALKTNLTKHMKVHNKE